MADKPRISRHLNKENISPPPGGWWPQDYTPALSVDEWEALLNDREVFTDSSLEIMKRILDYGGKATCTQLSIKYGESRNFYNSGSTALAKRIVKRTGCPVMLQGEEGSRFWPVLYVGKSAEKDEEGSYIWKLRDELAQALDRMDLSEVNLYANLTPRFWKISHGNDWISDAEAAAFDKRRVVVVNKDTAAKGRSKTSQGEDFMAHMKKATFSIYAVETASGCWGVSIQTEWRRTRKSKMGGMNVAIPLSPSPVMPARTWEIRNGGLPTTIPHAFASRKMK